MRLVVIFNNGHKEHSALKLIYVHGGNCQQFLFVFVPSRHPMVVSTTLQARSHKDVIFVSDSILEPNSGVTVGYSDRKGKGVNLL